MRMDVHASMRPTTSAVRRTSSETGADNVGGAQRARARTRSSVRCAPRSTARSASAARGTARPTPRASSTPCSSARSASGVRTVGLRPSAITNEDAELNQRILARAARSTSAQTSWCTTSRATRSGPGPAVLQVRPGSRPHAAQARRFPTSARASRSSWWWAAGAARDRPLQPLTVPALAEYALATAVEAVGSGARPAGARCRSCGPSSRPCTWPTASGSATARRATWSRPTGTEARACQLEPRGRRARSPVMGHRPEGVSQWARPAAGW